MFHNEKRGKKMAYLPKRIVEENIKKRVRKDREGREHTDYEAYFGIDPFTKKAIRITRTSEADLAKEIAGFYRRHQFGGDAAVRLNAIQALDARNAYDALAAAHMNISLLDAVSAYIGGYGAGNAPRCRKTIAEAYAEYLGTKPEGENKRTTVETTGRWAKGCGSKQLVSVTAKEVAEYLAKNFADRRPKTYNSHLLYLKTFFNWCCKEPQCYLDKSPIKALEYRPEPWEEPEYMAPEDVERLFRLLEANMEEHPEYLAYAVVNFFCGCRAVEVVRMATDPDAAKIDIDGATVRIAKAKGYQQGKRPRAFCIHPTALAWMKSFDFAAALRKVTEKTQKELYELARKNGIPVFHNCGRHTFITYHVAAYADPAKTTAMVGTSDKMRADNYCGLARKDKGEAYFKILPAVA